MERASDPVIGIGRAAPETAVLLPSPLSSYNDPPTGGISLTISLSLSKGCSLAGGRSPKR